MSDMNATVEQIQKDLGEYLHRVRDGETVVVFEGDDAVAELRPIPPEPSLNREREPERAGQDAPAPAEGRRRPIGLAKGEFVVPDDFDDPLPDDILDLFEGK